MPVLVTDDITEDQPRTVWDLCLQAHDLHW